MSARRKARLSTISMHRTALWMRPCLLFPVLSVQWRPVGGQNRFKVNRPAEADWHLPPLSTAAGAIGRLCRDVAGPGQSHSEPALLLDGALPPAATPIGSPDCAERRSGLVPRSLPLRPALPLPTPPGAAGSGFRCA